MDVSELIWCFSADFVDASYHRPHCYLKSGMATVPTGDASVHEDPGDLRDDLIFEITKLSGDLKGLGYEQFQIPDFIKRTCELPAKDAQIQKLRRQIGRMQELKDHSKSTSALVSPSVSSADVHSKSTSALVSPSVSSADARAQINYGTQIKLKRGHIPAAEKISASSGRKKRQTSSVEISASSGRKNGRTSSVDFPVKQHGIYHCLQSMREQTYYNAVAFAEYIFEQLILEQQMPRWTHISKMWLGNLPYPANILLLTQPTYCVKMCNRTSRTAT